GGGGGGVGRGGGGVAGWRVDGVGSAGARVARAHCTVMGEDGYSPAGSRLLVEAKWFVLAAGGIGTPAILIRSGLGGGMVGRRTYLHPVAGVFARWKQRIEPFYGPPQSVACHALAERGQRVGLFFEAAPLHPVIMAIATAGFGADHRRVMADLAYYTGHIGLAIDGFHPEEPGGTVTVRPS